MTMPGRPESGRRNTASGIGRRADEHQVVRAAHRAGSRRGRTPAARIHQTTISTSADEDRDDADHGDGADPEDRHVVAVVVLSASPARRTDFSAYTNATSRIRPPSDGSTPCMKKSRARVVQRPAVEPAAREPGQAVVERDHQADRPDERGQQARADQREEQVEAASRPGPSRSSRRSGVRYFGWILANAVGHRLVRGHRQRGAGGRQDRRLRRGRRRREDRRRQQEQPDVAERGVAEQRRPDRGEHVVGVVGVAQADAGGADAGERDGRGRDERVGDQQQDGRQDRRAAGGRARGRRTPR